MSFDPIDNSKNIPGAKPADMPSDLPEFTLADIDFAAIEKKASIFVKDTKFVPVDEQVKLVSVEKNGIIYEDEGKMQLANSQTELAENKLDEDFNITGFFSGFFGKKSMFNKKNDNLVQLV